MMTEAALSTSVILCVSVLILVIWGALMTMRGGFWRADHCLVEGTLEPDRWPTVAVVVPARNEAAVIEESLSSIASQKYSGTVRVFLVDDRSTDDTAGMAGRIAGVTVVAGSDTPAGWTGKMWAVSQGITATEKADIAAEYIWLTDADIAHHPGELASLMAGSEHDRLGLNSLMVRLRVQRFWDILLIPAFVFFFQKLYPFSWVNDPARKTAAAAGGSMLVRSSDLARIGGINSIAGELIDDCALAQRIKSAGGRIRLSLATETRSIRGYGTLGKIWSMVARTAFHQLNYSVLALLGTVIGMAFVYLGPPVFVVWGIAIGELPATVVAFSAWFAMAWAFAPTIYRYGLNPWYGFALPFASLLYVLMTLDSARRHWIGTGGAWKGRTYQR